MEVRIVSSEQELHDAFSVRKQVFINEQNVPEEEEIDQFEDEAVHFVLYNNGMPAGAGRFRTVDGNGKVERICVLKENRQSGSGKAIMDKIEEHAKKQGLPALKLNAQTQAIPFYEKLGYQVISEEFMDAGIPHRTMKKTI
ncbi:MULTISPECIES: GNAT family N-acetyltransferase [Cytobacillus]|uniref:GNAT family N-acetyltransferase n=3 Tax=Cytobacillus TaxID=2675230 RepID=A0A160MA01_9BACI|nr:MULTISPECIES: GNAT family N-acetyltransferase [Cytobacillus]AND39008.1 GNAT family N-acetyltransferase [Cytobacillus oceanisediminis 2691]MBU8732374.1 GNAT family N-acetyltransferase [Cytobacillus oceanisediminis]MBX9972015.1 GNAT family N-acetyltransferase [Cytobacillus firmus]MBY0156958.1 GNAT family N-acetyltransferase [Cytobacillus firmus]MCM3241467.1 GNAT family N-acetyltransferase [Cytobacillus oceanisediminis]